MQGYNLCESPLYSKYKHFINCCGLHKESKVCKSYNFLQFTDVFLTIPGTKEFQGT